MHTKTMDLSRQYTEEVLLPVLIEAFPEQAGQMAIGLVGDGSECFGFDDEISRDHDWSPAPCIWLPAELYRQCAGAVQDLLEKQGRVWNGYPMLWGNGRRGVLETELFFRKYLGKTGSLRTVGDWLRVPETYLAAASNGDVFYDPSGQFRAVWDDLRLGYPEDIRLKKMAARCMTIGQAGQYNYPRLLRRRDPVAAELAFAEFLQAAMSLVYLLNHRYAPFYKWMYRGMEQLELLGTEMASRLKWILKTEDRAQGIEEICELFKKTLQQQGLSESDDTFMVVQGEQVHAHISHEGLRAADPWSECGR